MKEKKYYAENRSHETKKSYGRNDRKYTKKNNINKCYSHSDSDSEEEILNFLNNIEEAKFDNLPLKANINIENIGLQMEVDTGACASVCHILDYNKYFSHIKLKLEKKRLSVITGSKVVVVGSIRVKVEFEAKLCALKLVIIDSEVKFKPLMRRNWLSVLLPNWRENISKLNKLSENSNINSAGNKLIESVKEKMLFSQENNSTIKGFEAEIELKEDHYPIFAKAYPVPFGLRKKVEVELEQMCKQGIIAPVNRSDWASPIVIVNTGDGSIRLCVDCSRTLNKFVETEHVILPRIDDILAKLAGWEIFCKIDLTGAYLQVKGSERSSKLLTVNTHKGLFRFKTLVFGLKTAPQIFSKIIGEILKGLKKVVHYFDDILVGGSNIDECEVNVKAVQDRLIEFNVKINFEKSQFFKSSIQYLGYEISGDGI